MTYTLKFDEKKYAPIQQALDELAVLEPGGEVQIANLTLTDLGKARWLIYDYLSHTGAKSRFRVRVDRDRLTITIRRIGFSTQPQIISTRGSLPTPLEPLLQELIALDNLEKAEKLLGEWAQTGKVSAIELGQLLLELRRVMS